MNVPGADTCYAGISTGMARAVMAEIAECLKLLAASGETSVIDLRSLPLTDADVQELRTGLGSGEVVATVEVIGRTEIRETRFAGVWWIRHLGGQGRVALEEIAVTTVPEILCSQPEDIAQAAEILCNELGTGVPAGYEREAIHG